MDIISMNKLAYIVESARKAKHLTQTQVQELTGINRLMIGRIEKCEYLPSLPQLNSLAETLHFRIADLLEDNQEQNVFYAMRGEAKSESEVEGIEKLFTMMSFLKSQSLIRSKLSNENSSRNTDSFI